jgi:hypothetical protein
MPDPRRSRRHLQRRRTAWYDRAFFDDRAGAWFGAMHQRIYKQIGVPMEAITVQHFLAADRAVWRSDLDLAA